MSCGKKFSKKECALRRGGRETNADFHPRGDLQTSLPLPEEPGRTGARSLCETVLNVRILEGKQFNQDKGRLSQELLLRWSYRDSCPKTLSHPSVVC